MTDKSKLSTESYKGVRDFYPEDMKIQNYIFGVWKKTAESFGYEEYSASLLEPIELYKSKSSEEIVSEQMFTFTDRGEREVALRPEMTPSLARMIAAQRKSLKFPLRWYSIPNLFRYERPQRGRLREHWQLNCDVMGISDTSADVEIIKLSYQIMKAFGAKDEDFQIKINNRKSLEEAIKSKLKNEADYQTALRLLDKKEKITEEEFDTKWKELSDSPFEINTEVNQDLSKIIKSLGISNITYDPLLTRGFDYYTGMVFEVFDTNPENKRSLFGGGRYDNLLEIFGVEPVPTVGFGMGDVTIRDFLETHNLPLHA